MNTNSKNTPNSPEDRLLDELLHEQHHGPDEAFLQQIEAAVDAAFSPAEKPAEKRSPRWNARRFAIAAGVVLTAGAGVLWQISRQNQDVSPLAATQEKRMAAELRDLNLAIQEQEQEQKVEEQRKLLATTVNTKCIIYKGQDSFYQTDGIDGDQGARSALQDFDMLESERSSLTTQIDSLSKYDSDQLMTYAAGLNIPENRIRELLPEYQEAKRNLETMKTTGLSDNHPTIQAAEKNLSAMKSQLDEGTEKLRETLEAQLQLADSRLCEVEATGDRYGKIIDEPWKTSASEPLSTFSIDVDTASYGNVRRMIREGREIPRDAVRIEECVNAFRYHYPAPKGDAPFAVGASLARCPWAPDHQLVRVAIKGREINSNKRPASNLVFLIDVSGSMQSPDKLPLLKQSMSTLVNQLDERDRVGIVVYAGSEGVALPSTRLDAEGRAKVLETLGKLGAGGSTNGGAGIKRAYDLAMQEKIDGGVNRVILATDGDFNVGVTGQDSLVKLVKERAQEGVYLTVLGYGTGNLNDAMMDAITRDGNGNYFYIDSEREGQKVFMRNLAGTLVTIAKDVKIQVGFNPAKVGSYRLIGYANRVLRNEDFSNDKVDAGDIGAGHTVTAFYELAPQSSAADGLKYQSGASQGTTSDEWMTIKLRHKHPDGNVSRLIEFALRGDALPIDQTDTDFQFATAVALFGMKLRGMEEVRAIAWDQVISLSKPGLADDSTEDRAKFVGMVGKLAGKGTALMPSPAEVILDNQ